MRDYWILGFLVIVIGTVILVYIKWKAAKSDEKLRCQYQKSFDKILSDLSSENTARQLTAAIQLRRFFMINELKKHGDFLKDDTGNRRYWVVPVERIDFDIIDNLDINMLSQKIYKINS